MGDGARGLVEGRVCGECTVCCSALRIDEPELKKPSRIDCIHLVPAGGCGIYADRPQVCRNWYCGWRLIGGLDDAWRPDRSRLLMRLDDTGLIIESLDRDASALAGESVAEFALALVERSMKVAISVQTRPGFCNARVPVYKALRSAAQIVDPARRVARAREVLASEVRRAAGLQTDPE